jgi:hypothetical protein
MNIHKGGRGIKAPYSSKVIRVPEPILSEVEKLVTSFYSQDCKDCGQANKKELVKSDNAIILAREILEQNKISKRSNKHCLEKLLQVLYNDKSINL